MKRFMPVLLFCLLFAALPGDAQHRWGARVGFVDGEPMIGGDVILSLGRSVYFNPSVELSGYGITANADAHYDIELTRDAAVWFGAGIALVTPEESDLDVGVNLLGGIGTKRGRHIYYAQLKRTMLSGGEDTSSVAAGIRF